MRAVRNNTKYKIQGDGSDSRRPGGSISVRNDDVATAWTSIISSRNAVPAFDNTRVPIRFPAPPLHNASL